MKVIESASAHARREALLSALEAHARAAPALLVAVERSMADEIAHELTARAGARFGLHRFSLNQLVAHLATEALAVRGLAPGSTLGIEAVAARVAFSAADEAEIPRLAAVRAYPGFPRALARTLSELRLAELTPERIAASGGAGAIEISCLFGRYERALEEARIADRAVLLALAIEGLASARHAELRSAALFACDISLRSVLERRFFHALAIGAPRAVMTLPAGDDRTDEALAVAFGGDLEREAPAVADDGGLTRVRTFLFEEDRPPERVTDDEVRLFSAPGEGRECVEIARRTLAAAAAGVPFDEIAVFLRSPESYTQLLETAFRRAGVPAYFARGTRRPDPSGRAFLALLACAAERLSARRFAEYLSFSQVPPLGSDGAPPTDREVWTPSRDESVTRGAARVVQLSLFDAPPAAEPTATPVPTPPGTPAAGEGESSGTLRAPWKWESYLVEAAVIRGLDRWRKRLHGYASELDIKLAAWRQEDPDNPRTAVLARERANVDHLERFALPVVAVLDGFREPVIWREWLARLRALAPMVLKRPERVIAVLGELEPMAEVGPVEIAEVREVLSERLATLEMDPAPTRRGHVFVATPEQARGRSFRHVFVPGLAERVFPQRPREDPLLLDAEREAIAPTLARLDERTLDERLLLRLGIGAATSQLTLSYPRVDVVEARPRVPSFYALDVQAATRGALPELDDMEREAADAADARLAWPAPSDPELAIDAMEHDLSVLGQLIHGDRRNGDAKGRARYLIELNEHLERSLKWVYLRERGPRWYPADGIVRTTDHTKPVLERHRPAVRPYSATALQRYATCPYQFLLATIHRLEPRPEPAPLIRMDPLTKGQMFHEIQARTLSSLRDDDLLPVTLRNLPNALAALDESTRVVEEAFRERLEPAIERVWEDEVGRVGSDLRIWLRRMANESGLWRPIHFELAFGLPTEPTGTGTRDPESSPQAVKIAGGYPLRGAVDLVEASTSSDVLRVTDHKTGVDRTQPGMIAGGGQTLQPLLYALAVENMLGRKVTESRLYFATSRGGYRDRVVHMDERARLYAREVLDVIDRSVVNGVLPPTPIADRSGRVACDWCDFLSVCGSRERQRTARKDEKLIRDLDELRRMP